MHNLKLYVQGFFFAIGLMLGITYSNYHIGIEPFGSMKKFDKIMHTIIYVKKRKKIIYLCFYQCFAFYISFR